MNKKEVAEIKRQLTPDRIAADRICSCYVDGEKNKRMETGGSFLTLPEEELFKYCDIFRKTLSGTVGKNLLNMEFPTSQEMTDDAWRALWALRETKLQDDSLLEDFYDRVIENYVCGEHYLILLLHAAYDIPGRGKDEIEMEDASDQVYDFILCGICPVNLSKAGLCYNPDKNHIEDCIRDWMVGQPDKGFLFPAFNDRGSDVHSMLYYSRQPELLQEDFVEQVLGCPIPLTAGGQVETFQTVLRETLGDDCDYETVRNIHGNLQEIMEDAKESPDPVVLTQRDVQVLLERSGASDVHMENFREEFQEIAGEDQTFLASNLAGSGKLVIRTPDISVQVSPERMDLVETRYLDGKKCLVIPVDDYIEVNGMSVHTLSNMRTEGES